MQHGVRGEIHQYRQPVTLATAEHDQIGVARERQADLIILGSRERHGLSILVNMTEDTVLHAAPCDVLAIRVTRG